MTKLALAALLASTVAAQAAPVRVATYNLSLNRNAPGQLAGDLANVDVAGVLGAPTTLPQRRQQAATVAEIIKIANPDILLLNEFDYGTNARADLDNFADSFVGTRRSAIANRDGNAPAPASDADPVAYQYRFIAPTNTGIASGFDLNNNGVAVTTPLAPGYGDDAYGFGEYEGRFGVAFLSKYEILTDQIRTFQTFRWADMPGNRIPGGFYSDEELAVFRLSSKNHWDIPVLIDGEIVHILASHPTPPVFDGPEDRNGTRNADEIRFWDDYISGLGDYIYDDVGIFGGLAAGARFVIMGDQNSDPNDGDSIKPAIQSLLANPRVDQSAACLPTSAGGVEAANQGGNNAGHTGPDDQDTADFNDFGPFGPGNLRVDHVLPSRRGLTCTGAGVFWPTAADPLSALVGTFGFYPSSLGNGFPASDHKLVYADIEVVPAPAALALFGMGALALVRRRRA